MTTYLLKLGELTLKGGNRKEFEKILRRNLSTRLRGTRSVVNTTKGRFFVHCPPESEADVEYVLDHLFGISGWSRAIACAKTPEAVNKACIETAQALVQSGVRSFKIEARRSDKSFPLDSYGIMREAGAAVLDAVPQLGVDIRNPEKIIEVEIREKAYIYGNEHKGQRGLPVGSAGKGLLLLSGGIDSPVAGFMAASRGMRVDAVYFHAYPYSSEEAKQKVIDLAKIIGEYTMGVRLFIIPFTKIQLRIKEAANDEWTTVLSRMAMMEIAQYMASLRNAKCLVSGESLSQVASQTIENMRCTESRTSLPVLRPLIGIDKDETVRRAKKIGTYETSILPHEDCCVIFSPKHPVLRASLAEATEIYESLGLNDLIKEALDSRSVELCSYPDMNVKKR